MEFRTQYNLLCTRYNAYLPAYDLPESTDQTAAADCMISRQAHENDSPTVSTVTLSNQAHGHDATTPTRPHGLKDHLAGLPDYLATLIDIKTAKETPYFFLYANRLGEQGTPSFERYFIDIVDYENTKHPALHLKLHPSITDFVRSLDSLARDSLVGDIHRSLVVNSGATSCHVTPITVIVGEKRLFAQAIDSAHTEYSRMRFDWYCDALRVEKNLSVPLAFEYLSTGIQKAWVGCDLFALHAAKASPKILQESYAEWITRHDDITQPHYVFVDDEASMKRLPISYYKYTQSYKHLERYLALNDAKYASLAPSILAAHRRHTEPCRSYDERAANVIEGHFNTAIDDKRIRLLTKLLPVDNEPR